MGFSCYALLAEFSESIHPLFSKVDTKKKILINDDIILVGGAEGECLKDIEVLLKLIGKTFSVNYEYTYAANETKKNTVKESNS